MKSGWVGGLEVDFSLATTRAETRVSIAGSTEVMASVTDSRGVVTPLENEKTARWLAYWPKNRPIGQVAAPTVDRQIPLVTACKSGKGQILVANVRALSVEDSADTSPRQGFKNPEWLFPPIKLGLPELLQPAADALRRELLAPLEDRPFGPVESGLLPPWRREGAIQLPR